MAVLFLLLLNAFEHSFIMSLLPHSYHSLVICFVHLQLKISVCKYKNKNWTIYRNVRENDQSLRIFHLPSIKQSSS